MARVPGIEPAIPRCPRQLHFRLISAPRCAERMLQCAERLRAERRAAQSGGVERRARGGRQTRRQHTIASTLAFKACAHEGQQRFRLLQHAAGMGNRNGCLRRNPELTAHRVDEHYQFIGCASEQRRCLRVAARRGLGNQRRQGRQLAALDLILIIDSAAEVEVQLQSEMAAQDLVERTAHRATVAHARKQIQALARDPVGRAFIAEQLAPAAGTRRTTVELTVGYRAGTGDQVDAILAGEGAGPGAHRVIAAAVAV